MTTDEEPYLPVTQSTPAEQQESQVAVEDALQKQPMYHVILWNDDDHTYDYVVHMMVRLFRMNAIDGLKIAKEVDLAGKAVVITTTREHAELKCQQIKNFGPDTELRESLCSMFASIEPVSTDD